jgi:hypothetical protein
MLPTTTIFARRVRNSLTSIALVAALGASGLATTPTPSATGFVTTAFAWAGAVPGICWYYRTQGFRDYCA